MAKGRALLVGLKSVDPATHDGWTGEGGCWGCELDVDNVGRILEPIGHKVTSLKTPRATAGNVLRELGRAAKKTRAGDVFVFYYSGHGGQSPDVDGDEMDGEDETLVTYDRDIIDDELNEIWTTFPAGARIVMLSDSCNSGTNYRMIRTVSMVEATPFQLKLSPAARAAMKAQLIHFGACRDGFGAAGYQGGGAFTIALCDAWAGGEFEGSYPDLHAAILRLIRNGGGQTPQYNEYGPVTSAFRGQRPFTVAGGPTEPEGREVEVRGTVRFSNGSAVVELNTDFGVAEGSQIPLARQKGACITVTEVAEGSEKNGTAII